MGERIRTTQNSHERRGLGYVSSVHPDNGLRSRRKGPACLARTDLKGTGVCPEPDARFGRAGWFPDKRPAYLCRSLKQI